jgi:hypothetical protein
MGNAQTYAEQIMRSPLFSIKTVGAQISRLATPSASANATSNAQVSQVICVVTSKRVCSVTFLSAGHRLGHKEE